LSAYITLFNSHKKSCNRSINVLLDCTAESEEYLTKKIIIDKAELDYDNEDDNYISRVFNDLNLMMIKNQEK